MNQSPTHKISDSGNQSAITCLTRHIKSAWCVLNGGHYKTRHFEPDRMLLKCVACGHESPGIDVAPAPPRSKARATC